VIAASDAIIAGESLTQEYSTNGALRRPIVWRFNILALESALYPKENRHDAGLA
jgi:hypothetical protein